MPFVSDLLTASAAAVEGNPTPTRTWQWLRDSSEIAGATSNLYTVQEADINAAISVRQTETNFMGTTSALSLVTSLVEAFSPLALFSAGEEGAWYEPSQTTAFQSTRDPTPCTYGGATGACGFLLDKSQGAGYSDGSFTGLGIELVENGDFETDITGWTRIAGGGSGEYIAGKLRLTDTSPSSSGLFYAQAIPTEIGKTYLVKADVSNLSFTYGGIFKSDNTAITSNVVYGGTGTGGSASFTFVATATSSYVGANIYAVGGTGVADYDNISVRELPGNHATQTDPGARPTLARVPEGGRRNLLERTEEFDNAVWVADVLSVSPSSTTDPNGGTNAFTLTPSGGSSTYENRVYQLRSDGPATYEMSIWARSDVANAKMTLGLFNSGGQVFTLTSSWVRYSVTVTASTSGTNFNIYAGESNFSTGAVVSTNEIEIYGPQLELGSSATAYQKVVDQYDITEAGVTSLDYLSFDGSDDHILFTIPTAKFASGLNYCLAYDTQGQSSMLFYSDRDDNLKWAFAAIDGATGEMTDLCPSTDPTTTLRVNGSAITPLSRDSAHEAVTGKTVQVWSTVGGANYYTPGAQNFGLYNSGAIVLEGDLYGLIWRDTLDTTETINTEAYLATRSGVTL
jgi:hypothetical protein